MTSTTTPRGTRSTFRGTLASVLTVLAVVVGAVGLAAPAQAATTHVTLSGRTTAWSDQTTTLTSTWKIGTKGHQGTVTLQRKSGTTWKKVASKTTTTTGVAKFAVKPASTTTYRVLTSTKKASPALRLTVKKAYALTSTAGSTIMAGTAKTFSLVYHHHGVAASGTALVERRSGSAWVKVTSVKITSGRGTVAVRPTATTTYRFRVVGKVVSASHTVTVKPPSTFTVTGSGSGHGVGMSQYGAYEMALTGSTASQILLHYYASAKNLTALTSVASQDVRVQVWGAEPYPSSYRDGAYSDTATSTTLSFTGSWQVQSPDLDKPFTGTSADHLKVAVTGTGSTQRLVLTQLAGSVVVGSPASQPAATASFTVTWTAGGTASVTGAQGVYHNGSLVLSAFDGVPNVVNDVPLNEYVYGISEMPSSWGTGKGAAALQAQAIAARTYAVGKVTRTAGSRPSAGCGCDLVDDVRDQNYTGWKKQHEGTNGTAGQPWVAAVDATGTQIVTYAGTPIQAMYFASSGGRTANNADVWQGSTASPQLDDLRSQTDPAKSAPGNPYVLWSRTITQAQAKKIFSYASVPLPDVRSIAVSQKYSSGQVLELRGTSAAGKTATVSASAAWWGTTLGVPGAWLTSFTPKP